MLSALPLLFFSSPCCPLFLLFLLRLRFFLGLGVWLLVGLGLAAVVVFFGLEGRAGKSDGSIVDVVSCAAVTV